MFTSIDFVSWVPALLNTIGTGILLYLVFRFINRKNKTSPETSWVWQGLFILFVIFGVVGVIISFPISTETRGQILNVLGIAITAVIAMSSTSLVGNLMASLMLKVVGSIHAGDFIKVNGHLGRVSEQGILHTEIQNEDRTLTTIPNLYLINNPFTVVRSGGTIVSTTLSLGYDVSRVRIEKCLLEAASRTGLNDSYVQVLNLGDFSVTYKISGFLEKVRFLISVQCDLRENVLDVLHENNIEIVSPTFMNQRVLDKNQTFIAKINGFEKRFLEENETHPEDLIFDKAEQAESKEALKRILKKVEMKLQDINKELKKEGHSEESMNELQSKKEHYQARFDKLTEYLSSLQSE
jgi:small conductance mechanosensitive channel